MASPADEFLAEGARRYRRACAVMVSFGKAVEQRLQGILSGRPPTKWGRFVPQPLSRARSTKYWSEYPVLNAKVDGEVGGSPLRISIDINWYQAEGDYPFYAAWLDPHGPYAEAIRGFTWASGISALEGGSGIRMEPDQSQFNPERDFGLLLDEIVRFLDQRAPR